MASTPVPCKGGKVVAIYEITTTTVVTVVECPLPVPTKPTILGVTFTMKGSQMTGTVALSALVPADHVTSRQVVVTLNGTALPPIEGISAPVTFTCNAGDAYSIVDTDINSAGSTASDPLTGTAQLPQGPPTKPVVTGVTFSA